MGRRLQLVMIAFNQKLILELLVVLHIRQRLQFPMIAFNQKLILELLLDHLTGESILVTTEQNIKESIQQLLMFLIQESIRDNTLEHEKVMLLFTLTRLRLVLVILNMKPYIKLGLLVT